MDNTDMHQALRVAVVTGGASGIGRATALKFAKDGIAVAIWDLDEAGGQETAHSIIDAGGWAFSYVADAACRTSISTALARTHADLGSVSILVNNAAITGIIPFLDIDEEIWDRMMAVNLKGPFLCTQAVLPDMLEAGWGRIVNISSSSTQLGVAGMAHYVSAKSGINGLTKDLAKEFADRGITVNTIPPGYIDTPMLRATARQMEQSVASSPMKRAGRPEDVAAACAFLVSEEAAYITGHTLNVNGGRFLQ
ncbi:MAG: 3-oxoacyl-ACP reductase FabG [Sphingobium sp.]